MLPATPAPITPTRTSTHDAGVPGAGPAAFAPRLRDPLRYQVLGEHGRGGLGRVSRAHDVELGRDIAIKELLSPNHISELRFLREALITARLEHPGIVPVHEAGRWPDGTPFYAMKLVAGRPLRDLIAERRTVDERIGLLHHVIAVADAIAYAHGRNIIHRDLKPSNVIVGDFGETVVIDWGLAKDVRATDDTVTDAPLRELYDDELTSAGAVLGTPAYMAPEQARGEVVDQRADVYAIGAMLWELCTVEKLPPAYSGQRRRILRRAGIDLDLSTIMEKAIDPDPGCRYRDAGALAADLKAFKVGARIAARQYSAWALLAHWTRRHVALAVSALAILLLSAAGTVLYVLSVTAERDRADVSEESTRLARASAESSLDALTLKHAQLLLTTDPSAALAALKTYRGTDSDRANQIRAEARGRGISILRATPHTTLVRWMEGMPDGSILSLSADGTIVRTSPNGGTTTITRNVARLAQLSYASARHLLAYACNPSDLCIYDTLRNLSIDEVSLFRGVHVVGLSFSRDGNRLALMSHDTTFRIIDVTDPAKPRLIIARKIRDGSDAVYFQRDIAIAGTPKGIEFIHTNGDSEPFSIPDNSFWDVNADENEFAIATIHGRAFLLGGPPMRLVAQGTLCHGPIVGLRFIPHTSRLVFGCREGNIGIWDPSNNIVIPKVRIEGYADMVTVSSSGEYVVAAGGNGVVTLFDLRTDLATSFRGHESRVSSVTPPSSAYPFLISADVRGELRTWPLPVRFARVVTTLNSQFNTAIFDKHSNSVMATTYLPTITVASPTMGIRSLGPHDHHNISLVQSSHGNAFATYGLGELVELWSASSKTRTNVIDTKQGSITQLSFVAGTEDIVTSGRDGRLIRWTPSGMATLLARIEQPIDSFVLPSLTDNSSVVFSSIDGALWHTVPQGQPVVFRAGGARVTRMVMLPDHHTVLVGNTNGEVISVDTRLWTYNSILHASGAVRDISTASNRGWVVVGTNDGVMHVTSMHEGQSPIERTSWHRLMVRERHQIVTSDGLLVAVCSDGVIWLYSLSDHRWLCLPVGNADFRSVAVSETYDSAAALDVEGRLIWIDLNAGRKLLTSSQTTL